MKEKKPEHGENTIQLSVYFWTNNIAKKKGHIVPKTCWEHGMIIVRKNESHGIEGGKKAFRSIAHIPRIIEELLRDSKIGVLHGRYTKGLYSSRYDTGRKKK